MPRPQGKSAQLSALIRRIPGLSPSERACLEFFKNLYIRHGGRLLSPTMADVARAIRSSKDTARRHTHRLRELGLLVPWAHEDGGISAVQYEFRLAILRQLAGPGTPSQKSSTPPRKLPGPPPSQIARGPYIDQRSIGNSLEAPQTPPTKEELSWARKKLNSLVGRDD